MDCKHIEHANDQFPKSVRQHGWRRSLGTGAGSHYHNNLMGAPRQDWPACPSGLDLPEADLGRSDVAGRHSVRGRALLRHNRGFPVRFRP
mgnify:CR=1 FL=1